MPSVEVAPGTVNCLPQPVEARTLWGCLTEAALLSSSEQIGESRGISQ